MTVQPGLWMMIGLNHRTRIRRPFSRSKSHEHAEFSHACFFTGAFRHGLPICVVFDSGERLSSFGLLDPEFFLGARLARGGLYGVCRAKYVHFNILVMTAVCTGYCSLI